MRRAGHPIDSGLGAAAAGRAARGRVLLVDEPGLFAGLLGDTLGAVGYSVRRADRTGDALAILGDGRHVLAMLEARLPAVPAAEFLRRLRERFPTGHPPVLATSAEGIGVSEMSALRQAGCDGFVSKLAPPEHLVQHVKALTLRPEAEPRRSRRLVVSLPVAYRYQGLTHRTRTLTLSRGGLFARTDMPPPTGTRLTVALALPDEAELVRAPGEVVHVETGDDGPWRPAGFGFAFAELGRRDAIRLDAVVRSVPC